MKKERKKNMEHSPIAAGARKGRGDISSSHGVDGCLFSIDFKWQIEMLRNILEALSLVL